MCFSMVYVGDDLIIKQQQVLSVGYDNAHVFHSFLCLSVKRIVTDISFSNVDSGDQEKI